MYSDAIIFDFDGTMADSLTIALDILRGYGHARTPVSQDTSRLRGMSVRHLITALGIPFWQAPFLTRRVRAKMQTMLDDVPLVDGIDTAVRTLKKKGYRLFIVTSNSEAAVRSLLGRSDLETVFTAICGSINPLHKERCLRTLART